MAGQTAARRLRKELKLINTSEAEGLYVAPLESNLFEWHFAFRGEANSCYREGLYWGKLSFPATYPLNAPNVFILTPNGRFQTSKALCLQGSTGYHNETWNPATTVLSLLLALKVTMTDDSVGGIGSLRESNEERERLARLSAEYNSKHAQFRQLFPELCPRDGGATPPPTHPASDSIAQAAMAGSVRPGGSPRPSSPKEPAPSGLPSPVTPHVNESRDAFVLPPQAGPRSSRRDESANGGSIRRMLSTNEYNWHRAASNGRVDELRKIAADGVDFCVVDGHGRNAVSKVDMTVNTDALYLLLEAGIPHLHHGPLLAYRRHHVGALHPLKKLLEDIAFHGTVSPQDADWHALRNRLRSRLATRLERPFASAPPPLQPLLPGASAPKLIATLIQTLQQPKLSRRKALSAICALADQSLSGPKRAVKVLESDALAAMFSVMQAHANTIEIVYHTTLAMYETVLKVKDTTSRSSISRPSYLRPMLGAAHLAMFTALRHHHSAVSGDSDKPDTDVHCHTAHLACRLATELSLVDAQAVLVTLQSVTPVSSEAHLYSAVCESIRTFQSADVDKMGFWFLSCLLKLPEARQAIRAWVTLAEESAAKRLQHSERAREVKVLCEEINRAGEGVLDAASSANQWQRLLTWLGRSDLRHAACRGLTDFVRRQLDDPAALAASDASSMSVVHLMLQDLNRPDHDGKHVAAAAASSGNVAVCDVLIVLAERGAAFKYHALPPKHGRHHVDGINRAHDQLEQLAVLGAELQKVDLDDHRRQAMMAERTDLITQVRTLYTPPTASDKALAALKQATITGLLGEVTEQLPAETKFDDPCPCCAEPVVQAAESTEDDSDTALPVVILPCKHAQHAACMHEWVQGNRATCPTCNVAIEHAWPDIPPAPPTGGLLTGVPAILAMMDACKHDEEVVALGLRQLNDQALTSLRRALLIVNNGGLEMIASLMSHHKTSPVVCYHGCYCAYELVLRVKDQELRPLLAEPRCLQTLLTIAERTVSSAGNYDNREQPWQDTCEMGLRLLTEVTLVFNTVPVGLLANQSAERMQTSTTSTVFPVLSPVVHALHLFANREPVEKFGYWFLLTLFRHVGTAQVDADVLFRWLQLVWPLLHASKPTHSKAKELLKLLPSFVPNAMLTKVAQASGNPHVQVALPDLPESEVWLQAMSWVSKPYSHLRGLIHGKATEGAVRLNAALVLDFANLLHPESDLSDEEVRHHTEALDEIHRCTPHGTNMVVQLAAAPSPGGMDLARADAIICLLERGAATATFAPAPSSQPKPCARLAPLTAIVDEFLFRGDPSQSAAATVSPVDNANSLAAGLSALNLSGSNNNPDVQVDPGHHPVTLTQDERSQTTSPTDHSRTPPEGDDAPVSNGAARATLCRRLREALGIAQDQLDTAPPPPPPEMNGRYMHYGVEGLLKRLRGANSSARAGTGVSGKRLQQRQAMLCRAMADQLLTSTRRCQAFISNNGLQLVAEVITTGVTAPTLQLQAGLVLKALLMTYENDEAAIGPIAMDVMLAALCILENYNTQVDAAASTSVRLLWAGVLTLCTECIERVGLASRRFAAVRRVVDQLRWLSSRVQQPAAQASDA
eukprot:TRINITY_DN10812_c0_g1_i2.p1 TRINITY_DN10812_c0_g1~~TRINITY_DN10812_c0_g1_i2.p1  ORF type:complete len:1591 (+),score=372.76 TRINITY_DN10812_c0_g1_i2:217-4989(+)